MSPQADFIVSNGTGAAVRSDLNVQLAAIVSNNSGATEPATMYAYQWWADTTTGLLKLRNSANSAWIELRQLDGEFTTVPVEDGSAGAPSIYFKTSGTDTGLYSPGADQVGISTGGTARVIVDSNGATLNGQGDLRFADSDSSHFIALQAPATITTDVTLTLPSADGTSGQFISTDGSGTLSFATPAGGGGGASNLADGSAATPSLNYSADTNTGIFRAGNDLLAFSTGGTERAQFDASGRLLVGTSTSPSAGSLSRYGKLVSQGNTAESAGGAILSLQRGEAATAISSGEYLGNICFADNAGNEFARIDAVADAAAGSGDYPGRLVFATTADSASAPTERMRITSTGDVLIGTTSVDVHNSSTLNGIVLRPSLSGGFLGISRANGGVVAINRTGSDGDLVYFSQAGTNEGTISVSGTTVSYNGAHLSRWSQLASGATRIEILRGTVLSNLDEMCEWIDAPKEAVLWQEEEELPEGIDVGDIKESAVESGLQENEQLNRMKVSTVEGDKNVSGVFQAWDDDDDTYTNDFYCAMTGDFIIRIAAGVNVERGDLLMSAGDGTAKPQDDDIIRSKTIAKVTSTNVSCTYEDGSYCVPCVLMAC